MHVLHVVKDLGLNGAARVVRTLADAQQTRGIDVAIMATPGELGNGFSGEVFDLPPTGRNPLLLVDSVRALRRVIRDVRPTVVHAHNPGIMAVAGLATARGRLAPAVVTLHGSAPEQYRLNAQVARLSGLPIIACGPTVAGQMRAAGRPVQATIMNGVKVSVTRSREEVRAELGVAPDAPFVVQVGRLAPQKNPVLAVEAFAAGAPADAVLAFVGDGDLGQELREATHRLHVSDRVRVLGGRPDAHDIMNAADVVCLASSWEGHPLVLLEAMTLGRAVVATRAPGSRELVRDGVDGLLAHADAAALGAALGRLCSDPELIARLGGAASERSAEFTQDRMVDAYTQQYEAYRRA